MMKQNKVSQSDARLDKAIAELDSELSPQRDLWQGIDLAIERKQSESDAGKFYTRYPLLASAASLALVAVLSWQMGFQVGEDSAPKQIAQQAPAIGDVVQQMTNDFEIQKQSLLVAYQSVPAVNQNWHEQLDELDRAAFSIKSALAQDPNNKQLLQMLRQVYQQQLDVINRTHQSRWQEL